MCAADINIIVLLVRFFNIPFKMRADPFNMIGVIGSLQQQRFITAVLKVVTTSEDFSSIVKSNVFRISYKTLC